MLFPWWGRKISYRDSQFPLMKHILETMMQVSRTEQHSTEVGLSWFVTVTQPECCVWTASGVKRNILSEVWQKYDVSDITTPSHNSTNSEAGISYANLGSKQKCKQNKLKIIKLLKLTSCMQALKNSTESFLELKYLIYSQHNADFIISSSLVHTI